MSKGEIILCLICIAIMIPAEIAFRRQVRREQVRRFGAIEIHRCKYNENPCCYEMACSYCNQKSECQINCGCNCDKCPGHKTEYIKR